MFTLLTLCASAMPGSPAVSRTASEKKAAATAERKPRRGCRQSNCRRGDGDGYATAARDPHTVRRSGAKCNAGSRLVTWDRGADVNNILSAPAVPRRSILLSFMPRSIRSLLPRPAPRDAGFATSYCAGC